MAIRLPPRSRPADAAWRHADHGHGPDPRPRRRLHRRRPGFGAHRRVLRRVVQRRVPRRQVVPRVLLRGLPWGSHDPGDRHRDVVPQRPPDVVLRRGRVAPSRRCERADLPPRDGDGAALGPIRQLRDLRRERRRRRRPSHSHPRGRGPGKRRQLGPDLVPPLGRPRCGPDHAGIAVPRRGRRADLRIHDGERGLPGRRRGARVRPRPRPAGPLRHGRLVGRRGPVGHHVRGFVERGSRRDLARRVQRVVEDPPRVAHPDGRDDGAHWDFDSPGRDDRHGVPPRDPWRLAARILPHREPSGSRLRRRVAGERSPDLARGRRSGLERRGHAPTARPRGGRRRIDGRPSVGCERSVA